MRTHVLSALLPVLVAGCGLIAAPDGGTRPLPAAVTSVWLGASTASTSFAAAGDSIVASGVVPPICGTQSANAKLVRGVVIATVVLAPNPAMLCALVSGNFMDRVVIHDVPPGSHRVTLAYEFEGHPDTRVALGWSAVSLP